MSHDITEADATTITIGDLTVSITYGDNHDFPYEEWDEWQRNAEPYTIELTRELTRGDMSDRLGYWCGPLAGEPTAIEALECLYRDGQMSGWATDPIATYRAYLAETGEELAVPVAVRLAEQNDRVLPFIAGLESDIETALGES